MLRVLRAASVFCDAQDRAPKPDITPAAIARAMTMGDVEVVRIVRRTRGAAAAPPPPNAEETAHGQRQREIAEARLFIASPEPSVRERAQLTLRKHEVLDELARLKERRATLGWSVAMRRAGRCTPEIARINAQVKDLGQEAQAIHERLGELSRAEKRARRRELGDAFIDAARRMLPPETFTAILREAQIGGDEET